MNKLEEKTNVSAFLDFEKIRSLTNLEPPSNERLNQIIDKSLKLNGLNSQEVAELLAVEDKDQLKMILQTAKKVKNEIYGKRMVIFAPLYTGNACSNNCLYCGFRKDNKELPRIVLSKEQIQTETEALLEEGHKRILMLCGENQAQGIDHVVMALRSAYSAIKDGQQIRRINVEVAPMEVEEFKILKQEKIGTYTCFQETYDPELYKVYHPTGPKSDYNYRLNVMDRAMEAGIDDVGIGVLFGLADYKYEVISILEHAKHLEEKFGCGPHTVSVPRLEPASGSKISDNVPFPLSDDNFKKIIGIIRISMPYTGIILSTRESSELRDEIFEYGISQVSAGSRTNPGGYTTNSKVDNSQFSLGDHRTLDEVISKMVDSGFVPSFCTGCYRKGRVGNDFMDLAKPGLIKKFCLPNGMTSFAEYLIDFASEDTQIKGFNLIDKFVEEMKPGTPKDRVIESLREIKKGKRDIYY